MEVLIDRRLNFVLYCNTLLHNPSQYIAIPIFKDKNCYNQYLKTKIFNVQSYLQIITERSELIVEKIFLSFFLFLNVNSQALFALFDVS